MKFWLSFLLFLFANIFPVFSAGRQTPKTVALRDYLRTISKSGTILFGQYDTYYSGYDWLVKDGDNGFLKSDVHDLCGDYPVIFGFDINGIKQTSNLKAAIKHHERGGIITISWHMSNLLTGGNAWDCSSNRVVRSILYDDHLKKEFCKKLDSFSIFCKNLKDKDGALIPILFRPWHESTSSSFWWGKSCSTDKEFKKLWKFTYNYLVKQKKVTNLIWVFSLDKMSTEKEFNLRYPGNKYVDIIGFEKYQYWKERENEIEALERFRTDLANGLNLLTLVCKKHKKIPAVTELGFAGGVPRNFWTYCVEDIIKDYQIAYIFIWSNSNDNKDRIFGPYPYSRDSNDFLKLVNNKRVLMLNGINIE